MGNAPNVISHIKRQRSKVERVRATPLALDQNGQLKDIRVTKSIRIEPYQKQFLPIPVPKKPGETLRVHSQPKIHPDSLPFPTKVDKSSNIYLPFMNDTKGVKEVKQGTLPGMFESLNFETLLPSKLHLNVLP